jgi:preprotein translocase subunit SecE
VGGGAQAAAKLLKVPGVKDKEEVSTAVSASPSEPAKGGKPSAEVLDGGGFQVHKPGEGYATRLGMMAVVMAFVFFACHHWVYSWIFVRNFAASIFNAVGLGVLINWTTSVAVQKYISWGGAGVLALIGFMVGYYFIYVRRSSAEFMIKTDGEMAKVTWPAIQPWFKVETKVWGATYVVLIVVGLMTLYVFGVDMVLQFMADKLFYAR